MTLRVLLQQFPPGNGLLERELLSRARVKHRIPLPFPCTRGPEGIGPEQQKSRDGLAGPAKPIRALHFALGSPGLAAFVCILHKYTDAATGAG